MKPLLIIFAGLLLLPSVRAQTNDSDGRDAVSNNDSITGRVLNDSGQPIANATIVARAYNDSPQRHQATTDSTGSFRLGGLETSLFFVFASAPGYVSSEYTRYAEDSRNPPLNLYRIGDSLTINLTKGGVITGTVTGHSGEPVVAVGVRAIMVRDGAGRVTKFATFTFGDRRTDDRGIYRLYGLPPGTYIVAAGGSGRSMSTNDAYSADTPTFAPGSPRETAEEVSVRPGEEVSGIDLRYRGEPGHIVSGTVAGMSTNAVFMSSTAAFLRQLHNGSIEYNYYVPVFQMSDGFAFYGVADGDYDVRVQQALAPGVFASSDLKRITVKGADVSGLMLTLKPLASLSGSVKLEASTLPECQNKRRPIFEETLVSIHRLKQPEEKDAELLPFSINRANVKHSGEFMLPMLTAGRYDMGARFFAKYWYLKSIRLGEALTSRNPASDIGKNGIVIKSGDKVSNLTVTLAEGAAYMRGKIKPEGGTVDPNSQLFLVPAELESTDNPLRYFGTVIEADGTFSFLNLAPGKYSAIVRRSSSEDSFNLRTLRDADQAEARAKLRREAEEKKTILEFKPCQNLTDYELHISLP